MESEKPDKDLIVDVTSTEVHIALMENHRLIEYNTESSTGNKFSVGDVYLGKVKKILPNLNAAFVDIGDKKEAFIHYLDLGLYFHAFDQFVRESNQNTNLTDLYARIEVGKPLPKEGKIEEILKPGQMIVSQIVKEPISTKGSRLTAEISLAGRNIVLLPFTEKVSISQKIASKEEKRRLETLVKSILPKNYGAIIRTAAEGKNAATLVGETKALIEKWESSWKKIARNKNVQLLFTEYSKTTTVLRDLLNDSFSNIWINDEKICDEARKYISLISPEQEKIVHLYEGKQPIYDHFEVNAAGGLSCDRDDGSAECDRREQRHPHQDRRPGREFLRGQQARRGRDRTPATAPGYGRNRHRGLHRHGVERPQERPPQVYAGADGK